jgi:hypothetical protein
MPSTREEIKKRMDELVHKYVETHDAEIIKKLYQLAVQLEKVKKLEKRRRAWLRSGAFFSCAEITGGDIHKPEEVVNGRANFPL